METKIKGVLREKRLTIYALHKSVGGNRAQLYQVTNGFCRATIPLRVKIADFLELPVDALFDENGMAIK